MKELRERKKLKIIDVAYHLGVTETSVRNWEHGRSIPKLTFGQIEILLDLYECTVGELKQAYEATKAQQAN